MLPLNSTSAPIKVGCYLGLMLVLNLAWELAQIPLYTLWVGGSPLSIAWAIVHCTGGDVMVAAIALAVGWIATGRKRMVKMLPTSTLIFVVSTGLLYTGFSEWRNTQVTHSWTYAAAMPLLPGTPMGLTPLLQWLLLPTSTLWLCFARRNQRSGLRP